VNEKRSALSAYLSQQPQEKFSLSGTVTDENGDPLTGATVSLTGSQSLDVLTDAQGKFKFSGLPTSGVYTVAVNKRHYTLANPTQNLAHPAADVSVFFQARLNRHSIVGQITREKGGLLSGVVVQLVQSPTTTATTGSDGRYSFPELEAGKNYTVVPVLEDFEITPENVTFEDLSENQIQDFVARRTIFDLAGNVTDENGEPLADVTVNVTGSKSLSAVTDSQGGFVFLDLPADGSYTISVEKPHYTFTSKTQTFVSPLDNVMAVFDGRLNHHAISGRLTRTDGTGIGGVVVQLATATTTTDANGFYSFVELDAGESYTVVPASNQFVFTPAILTFDDLSGDRAANFVGKLEPELITMDGSEVALALDAFSFTPQPFSLLNSLGFTNDGFIRVMIFAKNFEPVTGPSQVSVVAKDDQGQTHPVAVEFVGDVPGLSWLKQVNVKIPANTLSGKCVQLRMTVADVNSNDARICIK
jgi:hypothetical protein